LDQTPGTTIVGGDLKAYFGDLLKFAAENQRLQLSPLLHLYVTDLLAAFTESSHLFFQKEARIPILADILQEAIEADMHRRITLMKQLGDVALMVSGYFPESVSRRPVDLDYYHRMGEIAYSEVGSVMDEKNVFAELSADFVKVSDLINEVSEATQSRDLSILKLIDFYMQTGSHRAFEKLKKEGILPLRPKPTHSFEP